MEAGILTILSSLVDILALVACLGSLMCCLMVASSASEASDSRLPKDLLHSLWTLIAFSAGALTLSTVTELITRAAAMSGLPPTAVGPVLWTVLFETHYGQGWLIRLVGLMLLWVGWLPGRKRSFSIPLCSLMLVGGGIIAMSRSITGHAAAWGDPSLPELMDWLHVVAISAWGGSIVAFSVVVFPRLIDWADQEHKLIASLSRRLSTISGAAVALLAVTAVYNAWLHVENVRALLSTTYGNILIAKMLLLTALITLGASNRYVSVPCIQQCAGEAPSKEHFPHLLMARLLPGTRKAERMTPVLRRFMLKVRVEAVLVVGVLTLTACLIHTMPAHHMQQPRSEHHSHEMKMP